MWWAGFRVSSVGRNGGNKARDTRMSEGDMTSAQQMSGVAGACSGMLDVFYAQRVCPVGNPCGWPDCAPSCAARVSMMPLPSEEMCVESTCYYRRAYAPRTRALQCGPNSRKSTCFRVASRIRQQITRTRAAGRRHLSISPSPRLTAAPGAPVKSRQSPPTDRLEAVQGAAGRGAARAAGAVPPRLPGLVTGA
jgi:hypothetical protein